MAIETVWASCKGYVQKNYKYSTQTYEKMRADLIKGLYGNPSTGYKGITPKFCKKITLNCEKLMMEWLKEYGSFSGKNLRDFRYEPLVAEEDDHFEFESTFMANPEECINCFEEDSL